MPVELPDLAFIYNNLEEAIDSRAKNDGTFSVSEASATVEYLYDLSGYAQDYSDWILNDVVVAILGCSYVEGTKLRRIPPLRHPLHPCLYASRITGMRGEGPLGLTDGQLNFEAAEIYEATPIRWTAWAKLRLTVEFTIPPWDIRLDSEGVSEYRRYTVLTPEPGIEVVSIGAGQMVFAQDPDTGYEQPAGGVAGTLPFNSETACVIPKQSLKVLWKYVPLEFISDDGGDSFGKLESLIGKVNNGEFLGRPGGTLLMNPPRLTRMISPLFLAPNYDRQVLYDVEFDFSFFDPPRAAASSLLRGHNLLPYRGAKTTAQGLRYLYATGDGTLDGDPLFEFADFSKLFTHVSDV